MKQLFIFVLFLSVCYVSPAQKKLNKEPVLNKLEDFFRFENVKQLNSHFGSKNVYTESTFYGDPNKGGKYCLVSQVNFGTPFSVLVIWNGDGTQLLEVQTSAYFYDFESKKIKLIPNKWKTTQGVHAGMNLSQLVKVNWFTLSFQPHQENQAFGLILKGFGWLKNDLKVSFSTQKLIYVYTLDLKRINDFFPQIPTTILKSNSKIIRKWDPMLELVTIYRDGLKPEN
jgi:hypothetical protein